MAAAATLGACAHVPVVDESQLLRTDPASQRIRVYGAHGPLTARQSRTLLTRAVAQTPNGGALERHLAVEQVVADTPLYAGNSVRVLRDGSQAFPAIFDAIGSARHFLDLEYYTFEDVSCNGRRLGDLLVEKSREGVQVSVIYDSAGSIGSPATFFDRLRAAGVQVLEFHPINPLKALRHYTLNSRDHRKLLVADGTLAIVGGVNLSSAYQCSASSQGSHIQETQPIEAGQRRPSHEAWHDLDVEIRGPVVQELVALFRKHWKDETGKAVPAAEMPATPEVHGMEIVRILGSKPTRLASRYYVTALSAIVNAEDDVWITAAYFVPTHQELSALKAAARRGVDVRLILPSHSDWAPVLDIQRSHYAGLLRAGVKLYERSDGIVHTKSMVIDGVWSLVGSSNFDQRSVLFNDEVDAVMIGSEAASQLEAVFATGTRHARRITMQDVRKRGVLERLRARFWSLWQELL